MKLVIYELIYNHKIMMSFTRQQNYKYVSQYLSEPKVASFSELLSQAMYTKI